MLNKVIEERPVLMNRAPSLHKHSIQAFRVNRHSGRSVRTNPLINAGFNLDYDGDTTGIHVPISGAAVDEA
jgi:DNA-directed RNA polymerase subunit beta'